MWLADSDVLPAFSGITAVVNLYVMKLYDMTLWIYVANVMLLIVIIVEAKVALNPLTARRSS